jgi:hypothetical protein
MTSKNIWTINFATTVLLLVLISGVLISKSDLEKHYDTDIVLIYGVIIIGIYLGLLTNLFYQRIHKWGIKDRLPFHIFNTLTTILSVIILSTLFIYLDRELYFLWDGVFAITCGINLITFFWGHLTTD